MVGLGKDARRLLVMIGLFGAGIAVVPQAATAAVAHRPKITSFGLTRALTPQAGVVEVRIKVRGATYCSLRGPAAVVGDEWEGRCSPRGRTLRLWLPANATASTIRYRLTLTARSGRRSVRRTVTLAVPAEENFATGNWVLHLFAGGKEEVQYKIDFFPDGTLTSEVPLAGITGTWKYRERVLTFTLAVASKDETTTLTVSGPPHGPLTADSERFVVYKGGVVELEAVDSFTLEKEPVV